jgi:DNA-binding PadR family transcriptional regulator
MEIDVANLEIEMNRGFLQILVLLALEQKMYENTLYPILRRLEKNGLIKSEWDVSGDRPKKFYHITALGRLVRKKALAIWGEQNDMLKNIMEVNSHVSKS